MATPPLPDDVRALFAGTNIAHIASLLPDGSPHSVPVWVGVEGDLLAVLTGPGSRKARNVGRDPRVAISITDRERPSSMATVRGRVVERLTGDAGWAVIDRIAEKYVGGPYPLREDRVAFLVAADHAIGMAF